MIPRPDDALETLALFAVIIAAITIGSAALCVEVALMDWAWKP